jgi:hypothetical protein
MVAQFGYGLTTTPKAQITWRLTSLFTLKPEEFHQCPPTSMVAEFRMRDRSWLFASVRRRWRQNWRQGPIWSGML